MAASLTAAAINSVFTLVVKCKEDQKTINDLLAAVPTAGSPTGGASDAWNYADDISDFFGKVAGGSYSVNITYADGASSGLATGTITFTTNPANNDTITIAGVLITLVTGTPSGSQVKIGASLVATIANIVAFINAGGSAGGLLGTVTATATSGTVITINSFYPGLLGNLITMAKVSTAISAITATLTGGVQLSSSGPISVGI